LAIIFLPREHSLLHGGPGLFTTLDYGSFSSFWRVVWLMSSSRVDSAMRGSSISFLTRAVSLGWILAWDRFYAYMHDVTSPKGLKVNLEHRWQFQNCLHIPSSFEQSGPICET